MKFVALVISALLLCSICQHSFAGEAALAEVNAARAKRGLPAFVEDPALTVAATKAAAFRAERGIVGHTSNDFQFVPKGARASAAGCAANHWRYGFMSCCRYENWKYAGAAWVMHDDGRMFCHLFVR